MDTIKHFVSRDDVSDETKVKVLTILEDINANVISRVYAGNGIVKVLLDKGRYSEVEAVSSVFNHIVNTCQTRQESLKQFTQSLPDTAVLDKDGNI